MTVCLINISFIDRLLSQGRAVFFCLGIMLSTHITKTIKSHTQRNHCNLTNRCLFKPFHLLSHTRKPTYKSESVYTNHCIMFPLHLVFNLLLKILHNLLWLIIFPIRNHKIKDHIRMCWPFDHSKVMN